MEVSTLQEASTHSTYGNKTSTGLAPASTTSSLAQSQEEEVLTLLPSKSQLSTTSRQPSCQENGLQFTQQHPTPATESSIESMKLTTTDWELLESIEGILRYLF
jgi:hypothetical protein